MRFEIIRFSFFVFITNILQKDVLQHDKEREKKSHTVVAIQNIGAKRLHENAFLNAA